MVQQLALDLAPGWARPVPAAAVAPGQGRRKKGGGAAAPALPLDLDQRRRAAREEEEVYAAVCWLRAAGQTVYRAGRLHRVGDRLLTTAELLRLQRSMKRKGGRA